MMKDLAKEIADGVIGAMRSHGHWLDAETCRDVDQIIAAKIEAIVNDADRYRYIKNECVKAGPKIDGTSFWIFRQTLRLLGRAVTFDEVIDRKRGDE